MGARWIRDVYVNDEAVRVIIVLKVKQKVLTVAPTPSIDVRSKYTDTYTLLFNPNFHLYMLKCTTDL